MYIVSRCLLGENCKYNGENNRCKDIIEFLKDKDYIGICPECLGGLKIPRVPSEIRDGRVFSKGGKDVTDKFILGAEKALETAKKYGADCAILKQSSPSCGFGKIYDGSFTGKKICGNGITAELLARNGIKIITEEKFK